MARTPRKTTLKKPADKPVNDDKPTGGPTPVADTRLLQNFTLVTDAIKNGKMSCIVGVAITNDGEMIDMFGTAGNQLFECATLVQVVNLSDNLRGMQNRRLAHTRALQQQEEIDARAALPPAVDATSKKETP